MSRVTVRLMSDGGLWRLQVLRDLDQKQLTTEAARLLGGIWSRKVGSARVAAVALATSGLCCLITGAVGKQLSANAFLAILLVWGAAVVTDSPQFSALSAAAAPSNSVGGVLAIQNSIGFAITIASIALATSLFNRLGLSVAWVLVPGPILGLIGFYPAWGKARSGLP